MSQPPDFGKRPELPQNQYPVPAPPQYPQQGTPGYQQGPYGEGYPQQGGQYGGAYPQNPGPGQYPSPAGAPGTGPLGTVRSTGLCFLLFIVTLGIYGYVWWGLVHGEMKRHRNGEGLGGPAAVIIAIFVSPVTAFFTCYEVQNLYLSRGMEPRVRTTTGLWYFPGNFLLLIGPIVWFVKTNGALNDYWRALGAQ